MDVSDIDEELAVFTWSLPLLAILENVIRNSLESIAHEHGDNPEVPPGELEVSASRLADSVELLIRDSAARIGAHVAYRQRFAFPRATKLRSD